VTGRFTRALAFAAVAFALAACGHDGHASAGTPRVGVEVPLLTSPFWQAYENALAPSARAAGIDLLAPSNANGDTAKYLTDVRNFFTAGVDGLVLSPTDTAASVTVLDEAANMKIPVVTVDVAPDAGTVFMVVRADNRAYGTKACSFIAKHVPAGKSVVVIEGDLTSINGRERTQAFSECMLQVPHVGVLEVPAQWDALKAASGLEALLAAHRDVGGIYLEAGGVYLAPTISVLRRHGLLFPAGDPRHVVIVSNDGIPQELAAIRTGDIDATVSQPADLYAKYGMMYIKAALAGKTFTPGATTHGSRIVRLPQGMLEDELPAPLVTRANVNDPKLWGNANS